MKKNIPFLDLKPINSPFEEELKKAACDVITSGRYLHGKNVDSLEHKIAELCHVKYAITVSNGLDAIRLILQAYKVLGRLQDGDEVIVPDNTFVATALAVSQIGLKPVFADISPVTLNLDTSILESYITPRTKVIIPVHLYGTPCWDEDLLKIALKYNLFLVEDNAQAIGALSSVEGINGTFETGSLGNGAAMSFYPTKNLGALGDSGAITTNDEELARIVRTLANYGADKRYHNIYCGYNCRMDEIQAAMLLVKLPHLSDENNRRRNLADLYYSNITNKLVSKPQIFDDMKQVWHQFPIRCTHRDSLKDYLHSHGIETDIIYPSPVHLLQCYAHEYHDTSCPQAENFAKEVLCLPIGAHITAEDAFYICDIINKFSI